MRILHISKYYYPYIGGIENTCKYLVDAFSKDNDVAVVCFNEGRHNTVDVIDGIKVYRVGSFINISRQALAFSYARILRKAINDFNPDIIHFHWANPYPAAVLLLMIPKKIKLVIHWHMDIINQSKIYPMIKPIETALLNRANRVIVTSPNYKNYSRPLQPYKEKIDIVQSAIDGELFKLKDSDREKIDNIKKRYNNKDIIFFVGRHIQYKGLSYLIESEKMIKSDCAIVIAGAGPLTDSLRQSCLSSRVYFIGKITDDDLRCHLYASKVFAFPSITKNEAFGLSLVQAMYCATPAVTFSIEGSGVNWVSINNETCLEVPNKDTYAYANAIDTLLNDNDLYLKLSEAGVKRAKQNFLLKNEIEACKKCYSLL